MAKRSRRPYLLCHDGLSGRAVYRVLDTAADCVIVEVVSAPGLEPGTQLRFTKDAIARMPLLDAETWDRSHGALAPPDGTDVFRAVRQAR